MALGRGAELMPTRILITLFLFLATGPASPAAPDQVSAHGYGGIRIGMSVSDASKASGMELLPLGEILEDELGCFYVAPGGKPGSVFFMVVDDLIVRVDIDDSKILTVTGVGIGSTESEVLDAYPDRVAVTPHPYTGPKGHYLTIEFEDGFAIIFETDGSKVERYRAGIDSSISWIEGCS
jgi:hypothetical protein